MSDVKRYLSWNDVEDLAVRLARKIHEAKQSYDVYLGLARGGMFPALLLAQVFDQGMTLTAHLKRYENGQTDSEAMPRIRSFPSEHDLRDMRVLLIDEVWDRGDSLIRAEHELRPFEPKSVNTAVFHFKPGRNRYPHRKPTFFVEETEDWIVYPWEVFADKVHADSI